MKKKLGFCDLTTPGNRSKNPLQNPSLNKIVKKFSTANLDSAGQVRPHNNLADLDPNLIASGSRSSEMQ
jgi:hypothetical protein